jgi:predicted CXXCH cytochrome family protein
VRSAGDVEITYDPGSQIVQARKGNDHASARMEWVFGAGMLAFTPVLRTESGTWIEHRVSWYSASAKPGMTLGHPPQPPASAVAALGQPQTAETIYRCFNCHATGVRTGPDLSALTPGIQCERCHGPGQAHSASPRRDNIRKVSGVTFCAECHRTPAPGNAAAERSDPMMIRFAPVGLTASRCFTESGKLSCTTCHDPHGGPRPTTAQYETRCTSCHQTIKVRGSNCPRTSGCLSCHMNKATPVADLTFTDHRIRVYR